MSELNEFLVKIREIQALMVRVSTGRASFEENEEQYKNLREELRSYYSFYQLNDPNTFSTLENFYLYWRSKLPTYQSRRDFVSKIFEKVEDAIVKKLDESINLQIQNYDLFEYDKMQDTQLISDIIEEASNLYIFHAKDDKVFADKIINNIVSSDIKLYLKTYSFTKNDEIWSQIDFARATSDYILFIISKKALSNKWFKKEDSVSVFDNEISKGTFLSSIIIDDVKVPNFFSKMHKYNFKRNENSINLLINNIKYIEKIKFNKLNSKEFENLIYDLLVKINFTDVIKSSKIDKGYDIKANYVEKDPFGKNVQKTWLIETKLYKNEKPSLKSLRNITEIVNRETNNYIGLIVTNGQLTSITKNWLERNKTRSDIRYIEGSELKNILINYPDLVKKYFENNKEN